MMLSNIEKKIEKAIEDYMDRAELDFLSDEAQDVVKLAIDPEAMAHDIYAAMKEHIFRFDSSEYGDYRCDSCQKMFGDFVSEMGARVQADELLRPGVIIVLD